MAKFEVARFHRETGPEALFERVEQIFCAARGLRLHGQHVGQRISDHGAPKDAFARFEPGTWTLWTVEARTDTGRFVSTAWGVEVDGRSWRVVIGFGDTVRTAYPASRSKRGLGEGIVTGGKVWELVDAVNRRLVLAHRSAEAVETGAGARPVS